MPRTKCNRCATAVRGRRLCTDCELEKAYGTTVGDGWASLAPEDENENENDSDSDSEDVEGDGVETVTIYEYECCGCATRFKRPRDESKRCPEETCDYHGVVCLGSEEREVLVA